MLKFIPQSLQLFFVTIPQVEKKQNSKLDRVLRNGKMHEIFIPASFLYQTSKAKS